MNKTETTRRSTRVVMWAGVVLPQLLLLLLRPTAARAQAGAHAIAVPTATAAARRGAITLDGHLDEATWQAAPPVTEFTQFNPDHGKPASESMEVRFLYDETALYVGARLGDSQGARGVMKTVVRRDAFFNSDFFEIVIDGFHDHLSRAFFQVNPSGSRSDILGTGNSCCDDGWDPVWEARTSVDSTGWTVEMRIPLSQLRFSRDSVQTWGLQIRRFLKRRDETDQWSIWGRQEAGGPARFGHLEGMHLAARRRTVELLPYAMQRTASLQGAPGDPFKAGTKPSVRGGMDLKYMVTPNLTLDATVNPDFGQVEVDPAVVNLSAFEPFFQERRPFFVSSSGVFDFGDFNCFFCSNVSNLQAFYSRRVGRAPTGGDLAYARGAYADIPPAATILGAAKITGRTSSGVTVGLLDAVTGRAVADVRTLDGARVRQEVEPQANYLVGRIKKDLRRGDLVLGMIGTSTSRQLGDAFASRLSSHAELLGGDWKYQWKSRTYSWMGSAALTGVSGDPRVISARQLSSARFYQRPDRQQGASGFFASRLDSTATVMRGYGGYTRLAKDAGAWLWELAMNVRSPGFETNDYSFLTSADYIWNSANLLRTWQKPRKYYRDLTLIAGTQVQRNFSGDITSNTQQHAYAGGTTPQFWNWNVIMIRRPQGLLDDRLLRGGPSVRMPGSTLFGMNLGTDSRKQWRLSTGPSISTTTAGGYERSVDLTVRLQASTRAFISFGPSFADSYNTLQYVTARRDPLASTFAGQRYLLADVHQRQLGLDSRVNVTFSPKMTLELYAQPFFASGHYDAFKEFAAPRREAVQVYGKDRGTVQPVVGADGIVQQYVLDPDGAGAAPSFSVGNPDFNFRSLRGSVVYRWEYHPGSTLFFVWTQQRSDQAPVGDFQFGRDRNALLRAKPDNIFLVKASWWLAR